MLLRSSKVDAFEEVVGKARLNPPSELDRKATVSAFRQWIFELCVPVYARSRRAQEIGAWMEREVEDRYRQNTPLDLPSNIELIDRDRLDHRQAGLKMSSLLVNGQPLIGLPDLRRAK
jgi:hypothetical protein